MRVYKEINNGSDLRDWALDYSWCCDSTIERLDEMDKWDEVYDYIDYDYEQEISETKLNDILRYDIDNFLDDEYGYEEYEDEDEDDY